MEKSGEKGVREGFVRYQYAPRTPPIQLLGMLWLTVRRRDYEISVNIHGKTMFWESIVQVLSKYDQGTITPKKCAYYTYTCTHLKHPQTITK